MYNALRWLMAGAAVLLASCEKPVPPVAPPPEPPVVQAPPPPPALPRAVNAFWSFSPQDRCFATVKSPTLSLDIDATPGNVVLTARLARAATLPRQRAVPIAFEGPSGSWTVSGHVLPGRRISANQPTTEDQASQILVLLEGGTLKVGLANGGLPTLRVPNAGPAGRDWFECVRKRLLP